MSELKQEILAHIRELNIVTYAVTKLASGEESDYYIDVKKTYGYPGLLKMIAIAMAEDLDKGTTCLAANGVGGIPLSTALSLQTDLPVAFVRTDQKGHGLRREVDGYRVTGEDNVSVVDDVFTSGSTLREVLLVIDASQAQVVNCHTVVKRGEGQLSVPLKHLFEANEILN